jgi:hypothetical protein
MHIYYEKTYHNLRKENELKVSGNEIPNKTSEVAYDKMCGQEITA